MLKTLIQTILAILSSFAVLGSLFWFLLAALWIRQDTNDTPIAWKNIILAVGILILGVFGLFVTLKKIKAEKKRVKEKMRLLDKIEAEGQD